MILYCVFGYQVVIIRVGIIGIVVGKTISGGVDENLVVCDNTHAY